MNELKKLMALLADAGIPFSFHPHKCLPNTYQIHMLTTWAEDIDDVVFGPGLHGYEEGLLESRCINDCAGYLTAEEVFTHWKEWYIKSASDWEKMLAKRKGEQKYSPSRCRCSETNL